jgi:hypothetical protein
VLETVELARVQLDVNDGFQWHGVTSVQRLAKRAMHRGSDLVGFAARRRNRSPDAFQQTMDRHGVVGVCECASQLDNGGDAWRSHSKLAVRADVKFDDSRLSHNVLKQGVRKCRPRRGSGGIISVFTTPAGCRSAATSASAAQMEM